MASDYLLGVDFPVIPIIGMGYLSTIANLAPLSCLLGTSPSLQEAITARHLPSMHVVSMQANVSELKNKG
jgi:hypothetical protein